MLYPPSFRPWLDLFHLSAQLLSIKLSHLMISKILFGVTMREALFLDLFHQL